MKMCFHSIKITLYLIKYILIMSPFFHDIKMVSGQLPPRKIAPRLGLGFGLGLVLELG